MSINLLRHRERFAPSKNPYWFDTDTLKMDGDRSATIEAIWFGRKAGCTVVTSGTYRLFPFHTQGRLTGSVQEMIQTADTRYGGHWLYRWDGTTFQRNPLAPLHALVDLMSIQSRLDEVLTSAPEPFPGQRNWIGPYYKVPVDL